MLSGRKLWKKEWLQEGVQYIDSFVVSVLEKGQRINDKEGVGCKSKDFIDFF